MRLTRPSQLTIVAGFTEVLLHVQTDAQGIARVTLARPKRHDAFDQAADVVNEWLWCFSGMGGWGGAHER